MTWKGLLFIDCSFQKQIYDDKFSVFLLFLLFENRNKEKKLENQQHHRYHMHRIASRNFTYTCGGWCQPSLYGVQLPHQLLLVDNRTVCCCMFCISITTINTTSNYNQIKSKRNAIQMYFTSKGQLPSVDLKSKLFKRDNSLLETCLWFFLRNKSTIYWIY